MKQQLVLVLAAACVSCAPQATATADRDVTAWQQRAQSITIIRDNQAARYSTGDLREVYFYRPQLEGHIEKQYHPGQ